MKKNRMLVLGAMLLIAILLAACAGTEGPQGPAGPAGAAGPDRKDLKVLREQPDQLVKMVNRDPVEQNMLAPRSVPDVMRKHMMSL